MKNKIIHVMEECDNAESAYFMNPSHHESGYIDFGFKVDNGCISETGYDKSASETLSRIAREYLLWGDEDGSKEAGSYLFDKNQQYEVWVYSRYESKMEIGSTKPIEKRLFREWIASEWNHGPSFVIIGITESGNQNENS